MLNKRAKAREERDWSMSDKIRDSLKTAGWIVDDTPEGQKLKKIQITISMPKNKN